ncbi:MAG: energy-coupling factor ABC transporter ATP-binding protein [Candidatus Methylomirabilia bacterium]
MKPPAAGAALEASGVLFAYPTGGLALDGVDFRLAGGEFVALLASNGSGKTTLLKVLVGLLKPQQGTVRLWGRDVTAMKQGEIYRQVGMVLQNPTDQLFAATVEEDVAFGPRNLGLGAAEVEERVVESLSLVAALPLRKRAIHHISFGEQKRVAIAGVLAMGPSVLLLDEPSAGLDPAGEAEIMRVLSRLNKERGITVLLATHSVDMLPLFADRIYVLNRGTVLHQGPPEVIFRDDEILKTAHLRLPYISGLLYELKKYDGVPIDGLPLTIGEAREKLLELIPDDVIGAGVRREGA